MIPFDEIDQILKKLGKNRKWLAEVTGRSDHSIRSALAPNAAPKSRSALMQKALSDAIEREATERKKHRPLVEDVTLHPTIEEFKVWSEAFKSSPYSTLKEWAIATLNGASGALYVVQPPMVADDVREYGKRAPK